MRERLADELIKRPDLGDALVKQITELLDAVVEEDNAKAPPPDRGLAHDLYYIYQHEKVGVFRAIQKLRELFRAGSIQLSSGKGAYSLYQFDRREVLRYTKKDRISAYRTAFGSAPRRCRRGRGRTPTSAGCSRTSTTRPRCSGGTSGSPTRSRAAQARRRRRAGAAAEHGGGRPDPAGRAAGPCQRAATRHRSRARCARRRAGGGCSTTWPVRR